MVFYMPAPPRCLLCTGKGLNEHLFEKMDKCRDEQGPLIGETHLVAPGSLQSLEPVHITTIEGIEGVNQPLSVSAPQ